MNIRTLIASLILAALILLASFAAHAQDTALQSYEVELIVFRVNRPTGTSENWSLAESASKHGAVNDGEEETPASTSTDSLVTASTPDGETAFPALAATQFRMNDIEDRLRKGKNYQPLAHFGWTQPGFPLGSNPPAFSLQPYLPGFLPDSVTLTGQAALARGDRLLHLTLDLVYQAPDGQRYALRELRRMRSREKHYFDHPYFGVIALMTPKE